MHQPLLDEVLERLGIRAYFEGVYGLPDILARSKVDRGRELIESHRLSAEHSLYIGDTDHDLEVAESLGFVPIAVGGGHQAIERFDSNRALVVDDLIALRRLLTAYDS
jgi:phosphoglycolate phosphatase